VSRLTRTLHAVTPLMGEAKRRRQRFVESEMREESAPDSTGPNARCVGGAHGYLEPLLFKPFSRAFFSCTRAPLRVPDMASLPS
jgi:hypothetical protein